MDLSNQIALWLKEDGFFPRGIALLMHTGAPVAKFQHYIGVHPPQIEEQRLRYKLVEYLEKHPPSRQPTPKPDPDEEPRPSQQPTPYAPPKQEEPTEVIQLRNRAKKLHKKHDHLKAQLVLMTEDDDKYADDDRYQLAREIMKDVIPELDRVYEDIRKFEEENELPPLMSFSTVARQVIAMTDKIKYKGQRISKLRRLLKSLNLSKDKREKYTKEMATKQEEIKLLETKLGINAKG